MLARGHGQVVVGLAAAVAARLEGPLAVEEDRRLLGEHVGAAGLVVPALVIAVAGDE